jgi:hypothetical protein
MGLLPPAQVPFFKLLHNPAVDPARVAVEGDTLVAERTETITVGQVIEAEGPRSPGLEASQKDFRIGVVFLTRPGTEPTAEDPRPRTFGRRSVRASSR